MIERMPISRTGHERLEKELENLERRERHDVIRAIEVAREHGDLKENAEYKAAKEEQAYLQNKLNKIINDMSKAVIVKKNEVKGDSITFGTKIKLEQILN